MAVPVEAAGFHVDHHGEVAAEAFGHLAEGERGGGCLRHRVSLADALSPCRRMHGRSALGRDLGAAGTLPVKPVAPECAPTVAAFVTGEKPSVCCRNLRAGAEEGAFAAQLRRSEEHTSELQSLMRNS